MNYLYEKRDVRHYLLLPLAWLYSLAVLLRRRRAQPKKLPCKVVCVGNAVLGGAGKTPTVRLLADYFTRRGYTPHIISRGYGRKRRGNFRVSSDMTAHDAGDEALMLARDYPVWVGDERYAAGVAAIAAGADLLLLDDGYQNPTLHKDVHILAVDSVFGFGNRFVLPAGCLREPLSMAVQRADFSILLTAEGEEAGDKASRRQLYRRDLGKTYLEGTLSPVASSVDNLPSGYWVIFCGLARPQKFFATARKLAAERGVHIVTERAFADHHFYSTADKRRLWGLAERYGATLVTSEKDFVRFSPAEREDLSVIEIALSVDEALLEKRLAATNLLTKD